MAFLNPADKFSSVTLTNENLTYYVPAQTAVRTDEPIEGKIYVEIVVATGYTSVIGFTSKDFPLNGSVWVHPDAISFSGDGYARVNGVQSSFLKALSNGDTFGIAVDTESRMFSFYINGTAIYTGAYKNAQNKPLYFYIGAHSGASQGTFIVSPPFNYALPSGYKPYGGYGFYSAVYHDNEYKKWNIASNQWEVTNLDEFIDFSIIPVSAWDLLQGDFEIVSRSNSENAKLKITGSKKNPNRYLEQIRPVSLVGVESLELVLQATGSGRIAISSDAGNTYQAFRNGAWGVVADISDGMTFDEVRALSQVALQTLIDATSIQFGLYLTDDTVFDHLSVITKMKGTERLANTDDYAVSYEPSTKTIAHTFRKSGTFIINYVDGE